MTFEPLQRWAGARPGRQRLLLGLLFLGAALLFAPGIWEHTGVTGKDEYYLGLRTPLCMAEQDVWWVPCLDGEPRLKKPPMVYWLTRGSYELFGPSLTSARLVAVGFAALLVLATGLIGRELAGGLGYGLLAGTIAASFLGLSVMGRMLELDVPVAAFSALAFWALLRWYRRGGGAWPALAALFLAAGFLTKGPVVVLVCGAGGLSLLAFDPGARSFLARRWRVLLGAALLFLVLALPWFAHVAQLYPERGADTLTGELADRHFLRLSPVPLYGILLLSLPWSGLALARAFPSRSLDPELRRRALLLLAWLGLTLLPFLFFKSFERYLFGSLVPLALLLALPWPSPARAVRLGARFGLLVSALVLLVLCAAALWLAGPVWVLLPALATLGWLTREWWQARRPAAMALSAALAWTCALGLVYPRLGINQVPERIVELARGAEVVFYHGPQPALLAGILGRSLVHADERWRLPQRLTAPCAGFLLFFVEEPYAAGALQGLERLGYQARELERFGVLSSRVSWHKMARPGVDRDEILKALAHRDLEPIKPRVVVLTVRNSACPGA